MLAASDSGFFSLRLHSFLFLFFSPSPLGIQSLSSVLQISPEYLDHLEMPRVIRCSLFFASGTFFHQGVQLDSHCKYRE